ncbi:MAG: Nitrilase, partial [Thermomicrobiales bacterium]|nr:Nitrilase [Thermomicrobiales bacterium]
KAHSLEALCSLIAAIGAALRREGLNARQCTGRSIAALLCLDSACSVWRTDPIAHRRTNVTAKGATMTGESRRYTAAAIQATPVFLDREATLAKALRLIEEVAADGSRLIVFPEAFIPGYPFWLWRDRPDDMPGLEQKAFAALWRESIDVPGPETEQLGDAARAAASCVVIGVNERESACPDVPRAHGLGTG